MALSRGRSGLKRKRKAARRQRKNRGAKRNALRGASYAEGAKMVKPPAKAEEPAKKASVNFEALEVVDTDVLVPEAGLSSLQRAQLEAGIKFISSADEAFEFTDEGEFTVEQVICSQTGEGFVRYTYYAGDTACGFIVEPGTAKVRATIEDGYVVES